MLLYIHIPFCDSKCHYCAFNSYVDKFHLKENYMKALLKQLLFELDRFSVDGVKIETVFIGGGTPSCVEASLYSEIFELILPFCLDDAEITTEANPNSATLEWLTKMRSLGVNRVSFGVQSFNDEKLKRLGRAHNSKQAREAVQNAKKAGFENISLDLIYAFSGDSKELLECDLNEAFSLPINHLSAYALTIEEGTVFAKSPQLSSEKLELTKWFFEEIAARGFLQYEISNFGTYQSKHNKGYWLYKDYIGAGCGAVGKKGNVRFYPQTSVEAYIEDPLEITQEFLDEKDQKIEKLFLGFRSIVGVWNALLDAHELKRALLLVDEKKLRLEGEFFYNDDYLLADELALFISS